MADEYGTEVTRASRDTWRQMVTLSSGLQRLLGSEYEAALDGGEEWVRGKVDRV